jgi:hypothetical protein
MRDHPETVYVVFYTTRSDTGKPSQAWGDPNNPVYLTDHWEIEWTRRRAIARYEQVFKEYDIHTAGIAPIDEEYKTDWV